MKRYRFRRPKFGSAVLLSTLLFGACSAGIGARAANAARPTTVPGEIILYMQAGTPVATVNAAAAQVNATVTPLLLKDCYVLHLPAVNANAVDTTTAVTALKGTPSVRWVNASRQYYATQSTTVGLVPNDPMYSQQWNLPLINMPLAWTITKGGTGVNLAWIDSGFDPAHVDAQGQFLPGSYNFADGNTNITAAGTANEEDHGVGTSGIAFANTNNMIGIAGIDWTNIKCLALKVQPSGGTSLSTPAILNSYSYIIQNKAAFNIGACNMSYGGDGDPTDANDPEYVLTQQCVQAGIIMIASSGNSGEPADGNPPSLPADYPWVISVGATDRNGIIAPYSSYGKVDIAAPGGTSTITGNAADGVLSLDLANTYTTHDGTSNSAPHVTAVAGLMLSTPGSTPTTVTNALFATANRTIPNITAVPDAHYGYGLLDAYQALLRISVTASITSPVGTNAQGNSTDPTGLAPQPVDTLNPPVSITVSNVPPANLAITIDPSGADVTLSAAFIQSHIQSGNALSANPQYTVAFNLLDAGVKFSYPSDTVGSHQVQVVATNPATGVSVTQVTNYNVQPFVFPSGISMVAIPYHEAGAYSPTGTVRDVAQLLPTATLYRWIESPATANGQATSVGSYAAFGANGTNTAASLNTTLMPPIPDGTSTLGSTVPVGVGYFISTPAAIPVVTYGVTYGTTAFDIPMHEGWNLLGNPYDFAIPFNGLEIQELNGARSPIANAVDAGTILPYVFTYSGGQYGFETLPAGAISPWQSAWVYVIPKNPANLSTATALTVITTPIPILGTSTRAVVGSRAATATPAASTAIAPVSTSPAPIAPRATGVGSWSLQLQARTQTLTDSNNYVGMTRATGVLAQTLVPKPPKPSPYVNLTLGDNSTSSSSYMQDLQPVGGVKTWNVNVATDQANSDVTLTWPMVSSVPKGYALTLLDSTAGQTIDLRHRASYTFNSGHGAATRAFVLTASPTSQGSRPVVTNIVINPGRTSAGGRSATPYEIGYTVSQDVQIEVTLLGVNGQEIAVVSPTRAVSGGDSTVSWSGRDSHGKLIPAGAYLFQFKAIASDGSMTREVRPLVLTGR